MASEKRKAYLKEYWQRDDVKAKQKEKQATRYYTDEGQAYEKKHGSYARSRWVHARTAAKKRKLEFTITFEQYCEVIGDRCEYCNDDISRSSGHRMDRIDNTLGYAYGNVITCCGQCNRRRHQSMSSEEFKKQTKLNGRWKE